MHLIFVDSPVIYLLSQFFCCHVSTDKDALLFILQVFIKRVKNFALKFSAGDRAVSIESCVLKRF